MAKLDKEKVLEGISSVISLWLELKKKKKRSVLALFHLQEKTYQAKEDVKQGSLGT